MTLGDETRGYLRGLSEGRQKLDQEPDWPGPAADLLGNPSDDDDPALRAFIIGALDAVAERETRGGSRHPQ